MLIARQTNKDYYNGAQFQISRVKPALSHLASRIIGDIVLPVQTSKLLSVLLSVVLRRRMPPTLCACVGCAAVVLLSSILEALGLILCSLAYRQVSYISLCRGAVRHTRRRPRIAYFGITSRWSTIRWPSSRCACCSSGTRRF